MRSATPLASIVRLTGAPRTSWARSPGTSIETDALSGTTIFCVPPGYAMVNSLPLVALTTASTEAFVIVWSSRPSKGRWPGFSGLGKRRTSCATRVPSGRFCEVTPRKSPGLMSASEIGFANTISVFSLIRTRSLPFTVMALPSTAVIVPRTRVCADAQLAANTSARNTTLVRRLDAILAHVEALDHDLAAFLARVGPDPFAGLQVGARAWIEGDDRRARRDEDLLRSALVVERDLVAAARLRD